MLLISGATPGEPTKEALKYAPPGACMYSEFARVLLNFLEILHTFAVCGGEELFHSPPTNTIHTIQQLVWLREVFQILYSHENTFSASRINK